jgi:glycosyltransferase involved in cell wall biosynthesis
VAKRLVAAGNEVEWFAASFKGASPQEMLEGVRIVRRGQQWSVHLRAYMHYRKRVGTSFDLVIDQINTIPFFTPLWAGIPIFVMIWQLAREVWWYESTFPLNALGYFMEPIYLRAYRRTPVLTFGQSTASDLRRLGFRGQISVLPVGVETIDIGGAQKAHEPTFVYAGRLAPSKRIHELVEAFALFRREANRGRLVLIGRGSSSYEDRLRQTALRLRVVDQVEFCGWLQGHVKHERMAEAHALVMASVREGWGLVVSEANLCGTPAIVYDVPGLRDSVRNELTGLVVPPGPRNLATAMLRLAGDPELLDRLSNEAKRWGTSLTFDQTLYCLQLLLRERLAGRPA